jgi:glycine/D-amino acid oxidase-like deaminating enzyme
VAVLGAGLAGVSTALELACHGVTVDLYDRREECLAGASLNNEGKIHLGFTYANDPTLATARVLIRGALAFAPLLRRWLGRSAVERMALSPPFTYAVHRDSLLPAEQVREHLLACERLLRTQVQQGGDYFGARNLEPVRASSPDGGVTAAAFATPEVAVDSEGLAEALRDAIRSEPRICLRLGTRVMAVREPACGLSVDSRSHGERSVEVYDHVVNALWEGRQALDAAMGLAHTEPWLYRVKYFLRGLAASPGLIPATTIVLGPFGDVVPYNNGQFYLSWYPSGMQGMSSELRPPDWPDTPDDAEARTLRQRILDGLQGVIPAVANLGADAIERTDVRGGVIVANGATDIDDPISGLHRRSSIGVRSHGCYHSISTGKLTTAPMFGKEAADRVLAGDGRR